MEYTSAPQIRECINQHPWMFNDPRKKKKILEAIEVLKKNAATSREIYALTELEEDISDIQFKDMRPKTYCKENWAQEIKFTVTNRTTDLLKKVEQSIYDIVAVNCDHNKQKIARILGVSLRTVTNKLNKILNE